MQVTRSSWKRAAAAVAVLPLCYVIFVLRPHVLHAGSPLPFWLLCLGLAAALTAVQAHLFGPLSRMAAWGWGGFNFLVLLSQGQALRFSTDAALILQADRNFLDGLVPFPNYWYVPGILDFSKDEIFWNYWWSPVATWVTLPFLLLFRSAHQAVHVLIYLCLFAGFTGWLRIARELGLGRMAQGLFLIFLLSYLVAEKVLVFYVVDVLPFALSPWLFWALLRTTDNFRRDPLTVPAGRIVALAFAFGLTYFVKFSFVFSGVGYLALLEWWLVLPWSKRRAGRAIAASVSFALPLLLTIGLGYWLADVNNVTSQFREYENTAFSADNLLRFKLALLLPGDLFLSASHFPWWKPTWHFILSTVFIYAIAVFGRTRKLRLPLAVLFAALILVPTLGLLYASIRGNHDGMYVGRYRFSFAPVGFLIFFLADWSRATLREKRSWLAVGGIVLLIFSSTLPALRLLGIALKDFSRGPYAGIHQSSFYTESTEKAVNWLNENRTNGSLLATAFIDDDYELLAVLRGRVMALYFPEGCLNVVMKPYYLRHGLTNESEIGGHRWTTSEDRDVFLFISNRYFLEPEKIAAFRSKFPQVGNWEEVYRERNLTVLKGRALAKTGLHGRLE